MIKIKDIIPYIIIFIIVMFIRTYIITPVRVVGTSMDPHLFEGEIMMLDKLSDIKRNDIVVVSNEIPGDEIIKRVIALPGESVEAVDGIIYIDDKVAPDVYGVGQNGDFNKVYLGMDEYWVMGDNREVSLDSRVFGKVKKSNIEGVADFVVYPFNNFGKVINKR